MPSFSLPIMKLFSDPIAFLKSFIISAPAILIALTLHELAHGLVANWCGDPTAKMLGRLTLNPFKHLDLLGTVLLFLVGFGYAKPVPINPNNFRHPRRDDFFVSIAGIVMNLLLFTLFGTLFLCYINFASSNINEYLYYFLYYCAEINACLAVFNLIPLPPLDGYHVLNDVLLKRPLFATRKQSQMGQGIMLLLIITGILNKYISFCVGDGTSGLWGALFYVFKSVAERFI